MSIDPLIDEFLIRAALEVQPFPAIAADLGVDRKMLTQWENDVNNHNRLDELSAVRRIFIRKKFKNVSPREFYNWFKKTTRKCYYCNFTELEIQELLAAKRIFTKRITTRGKTLEIERLVPNKPYDELENLVYCCYWCNNAKTDEFSPEEFKLVGQVLKIVWSGRLRNLRLAAEK